jgi:hypothetical protein
MSQTDKYMTTLVESVIELLDIPESYYRKAEDRYQSLGRWFNREGSPLEGYAPHVYVQGSFRYGTVIRPLLAGEVYDLDLVCQIEESKSERSQKSLKHLIGDDVKAYAEAHSFKEEAEEKKRCWRLNYADDDLGFHMDILPAVPEDGILIERMIDYGVPRSMAEKSVAITDNEHPNYSRIEPVWPQSNPRGFAMWFEGRMREVASPRILRLVENRAYASVDAVPSFEWKTPLQRVIQLLKRHRDVMFQPNPKLAPISMIITTLATHAYDAETDVYAALLNVVTRMPEFVRTSKPWVPNPVNPPVPPAYAGEDFADKWNDNPKLRDAFMMCHVQLLSDVSELGRHLKSERSTEVASKAFGVQLRSEHRGALDRIAAPAVVAGSTSKPVTQISSAPQPWRQDA